MIEVRSLVDRFRQLFVVFLGAALCIFILIPFCTAALLSLSLNVESTNYFFVSFLLESIALALAGFLTGLLMSICVPGREMKTSLMGVLIVIPFYICVMAPLVFVSQKLVWKLYWLSEMAVGVLFLVGGAMVSAWFIAKMRSSRSQYQTNSK